MRPVTLKEIAKELGISVATVSKALKGYQDVSPKTRKRVLELTEKLNYSPNTAAISLRKQHTKTIGVIIPTIVHYFFSSVIEAIIKIADSKDYLVILLQSDENFELEKKQVNLLLSKGIDGLIISLSNHTRTYTHLKKLQDYNVPFVQIDKISKIVHSSKVIIDDRKAAYNAVSYLIEKGYKKIAHFRAGLNPQNSIDRYLGYKKALEDNDIPLDPSLVYICDNNRDFEDGIFNAEKMIKEHGNSVDAIFTVNDMLAIGAIHYFRNNDIKIPEEIAVFGFSNWFMSSVISPKLSTVNQDGSIMGEAAINVLFEEIENKRAGKPALNKTVVIDTDLVIREST
ncbi:LacI family DNA-binding transcriptional regulator [Seonamhaeicola sp.]|uniref:LacI family DNA-binding transcriptional regulator n=1 Tax=Seonamhaeicola sp. TaxID=1912245 RepID=UPI00262FCBC4|nr:LacI family DNA-binding transcriptional regulator [Seonamhaeicola sp.]